MEFAQPLMLEINSLLSRLFAVFLSGEAGDALCSAKFNRKGRPSTS